MKDLGDPIPGIDTPRRKKAAKTLTVASVVADDPTINTLSTEATLTPNDRRPPSREESRLSDIACEVQALDKTARDSFAAGFQNAIKAGELLLEAKKILKHGQWLPWLRDNCRVKERMARYYMQIARHGAKLPKSATVADFTIREAIASIANQHHRLARLPAPVVEETFAEHASDDFTLGYMLRRAENQERHKDSQKPEQVEERRKAREEQRLAMLASAEYAAKQIEMMRDAPEPFSESELDQYQDELGKLSDDEVEAAHAGAKMELRNILGHALRAAQALFATNHLVSWRRSQAGTTDKGGLVSGNRIVTDLEDLLLRIENAIEEGVT